MAVPFQDTKHQSMMDLEIKDYERTIETMTEQITTRDDQLTSQQQELIHHTQQIEQLHTQIGVCVCVCVCVRAIHSYQLVIISFSVLTRND